MKREWEVGLGGAETGKEFELRDGKVRFIPLGMFQEREKNFKKKSFDERVGQSWPYIGTAVIREAAECVGAAVTVGGGFGVGKVRYSCLNLCALRSTRASHQLSIGVRR